MPTLSVKLPEETKQRIQAVAQNQGTTVHAVMVDAVMAALAEAEHPQSLVSAALRARQQVLATGKVMDGHALDELLKARTRLEKVRRPRPIGLESLGSAGK